MTNVYTITAEDSQVNRVHIFEHSSLYGIDFITWFNFSVMVVYKCYHLRWLVWRILISFTNFVFGMILDVYLARTIV